MDIYRFWYQWGFLEPAPVMQRDNCVFEQLGFQIKLLHWFLRMLMFTGEKSQDAGARRTNFKVFIKLGFFEITCLTFYPVPISIGPALCFHCHLSLWNYLLSIKYSLQNRIHKTPKLETRLDSIARPGLGKKLLFRNSYPLVLI